MLTFPGLDGLPSFHMPIFISFMDPLPLKFGGEELRIETPSVSGLELKTDPPMLLKTSGLLLVLLNPNPLLLLPGLFILAKVLFERIKLF